MPKILTRVPTVGGWFVLHGNPHVGQVVPGSGVEVGAEVHKDERIYPEELSKLEAAAGAIRKVGIED